MSERVFDFRPRALAALLRPVVFCLAIVAGVVFGDRSGSFWIGVLAFLVASGAGKALRRLVARRLADAVHTALWPAAAAGLAVLFWWLGVPGWAVFFVALIAGGMLRGALAAAFLPAGAGRRLAPGTWGAAGDAIRGQWRRADG